MLPDVLSLLPAPFEWVSIPSRETRIEIGKWENFQYILEENYSVPQGSSFYIAKYPITNLQYQVFLDDPQGYGDVQNWDYSPEAFAAREANPEPHELQRDNDRPAVWVSYYDALAFCVWLKNKLSTEMQTTLPAESQWQIAAQGASKRRYPWGDTFNPALANTRERSIVKTTPVIDYPQGISPYGVMGMSGNVWEWCASDVDEGSVLRGGSWRFDGTYATTTYRYFFPPDEGHGNIGFRILCQMES